MGIGSTLRQIVHSLWIWIWYTESQVSKYVTTDLVIIHWGSFFKCVSACSIVSNSLWPYTVAHQAPLPIGFSRQEYWSELSFPPLWAPVRITKDNVEHMALSMYSITSYWVSFVVVVIFGLLLLRSAIDQKVDQVYLHLENKVKKLKTDVTGALVFWCLPCLVSSSISRSFSNNLAIKFFWV